MAASITEQDKMIDPKSPWHVDLEDSLVRTWDEQKKELIPCAVNCDTAANLISNQNHYVHIIETGKTYFYVNGVYLEHGDLAIKRLLQSYYQDFTGPKGRALVPTNTYDEIVRKVEILNLRSLSVFQSTEPVFNVANGVLNLETLELEQPSPERYILNESPVEYNPDAECTEWLEFLDTTLDKKFHDTVQEIFGYSLWPDYHVHKAFMLYGPPRSGKGVTISVLEGMIGQEDCSHVSLQNIVGNRFMPAELYGKKINTYGDLPSAMIVDPGVFKAACGGDGLTVEKKNGQPFTMYNKAKLIFSANQLPKLSAMADDQGAFHNRWIIIPYEKSFLGREDTTLKARLTTPDELSGVSNWSLNGLERLRNNSWQFTSVIDSSKLYRRASDPQIAFLEDCCEIADGYETKDDLLVAYNDYAKKNRLPLASSKKAFGQVMKDQTVIPVREFLSSTKKGRQEAWHGIKLKKGLFEYQ